MENISFITSLLTFNLKGSISWDQGFVNLTVPNTILGIFPFGSNSETIPVPQIASVETKFKFFVIRFLVGYFILDFGLGAMFSGHYILALLLLAVGLLVILGAFHTRLNIKTTAGGVKSVDFVFFEKDKAKEAAAGILQMVSEYMDSHSYAIRR